MATKTDKGAAATATRLETHEQAAEQKVNDLIEKIDALNQLSQPNSTDEEKKNIGEQVSALERRLVDAYKLWFELSKQVRDYYKAVDATKRDGEKISRVDVENILTQAWRFQRMARETFIPSIAQGAVQCKDEQDFYIKYADGIRDCEMEKLRSAIDNEKFPSWVLECYERSL